MSSVTRSAVTGVGGYLPEMRVTNADLESLVETSDAWIQERTGIKARHRGARLHQVGLAAREVRLTGGKLGLGCG